VSSVECFATNVNGKNYSEKKTQISIFCNDWFLPKTTDYAQKTFLVNSICWFQSNSDIYTGWVYEGRAYVTDRFAYGRQLPAIDPADRQDIYEVGGKIEDDIQVSSYKQITISLLFYRQFGFDEKC
jgi:hypothetical protein